MTACLILPSVLRQDLVLMGLVGTEYLTFGRKKNKILKFSLKKKKKKFVFTNLCLLNILLGGLHVVRSSDNTMSGCRY